MISKLLSSLIVLAIMFFQYQLWYGENGKQEIAGLQKKIDQQQQQKNSLIKHNGNLKNEIELLRNDPNVLEEKAREQLGLVKKDELFYRVIPTEID